MQNTPFGTIQSPEDPSENTQNENSSPKAGQQWGAIWEKLVRLGLGETTLKLGTSLISIVLVLSVVGVMGRFYLPGEVGISGGEVSASSFISPVQETVLNSSANDVVNLETGVKRNSDLHTIFPARPRVDVLEYVVESGDSLFGIAEKFNLKPETILWGNYYLLADDVHRIQSGQILNILPVDGVYYEWHAGDGLNGVAKFYGVAPEDIINWPGNRLQVNTLGDWTNPNIEPGTWLIIPGGERAFVSWSAPRITRTDPAVAKIFGPGYCGEVVDGPIGSGSFIWPTVERWLSGYDYSPASNHYAIDIAGQTGNAVYAVDDGVVVYAGWNDWGYGNVVVIDHGNGWQSLYAHLNSINVACGGFISQGDVFATVGNTGNSSGAHLHFELQNDQYGKVNPWNFLQ
jgi:LysM repeat protein